MFITFELWKHIIEYIEDIKKKNNTNGIMICGSLANNLYKSQSDIDLLCLSDSIEFSMICKKSENYIFDQMFANANLLINILKENTELSNVLSLSFGLHQLIIEDSNDLREIIEKAKSNILYNELQYERPKNKEPHILEVLFTVKKINNKYRLMKNDKVIL